MDFPGNPRRQYEEWNTFFFFVFRLLTIFTVSVFRNVWWPRLECTLFTFVGSHDVIKRQTNLRNHLISTIVTLMTLTNQLSASCLLNFLSVTLESYFGSTSPCVTVPFWVNALLFSKLQLNCALFKTDAIHQLSWSQGRECDSKRRLFWPSLIFIQVSKISGELKILFVWNFEEMMH